MTDDSEQGRWVGLRVREERQRRGWTGATLAEKAGIAPNTVVAIEQGRRVRPGSIAKVRAALDLEVDAPPPDPYTESAVEAVREWMTSAATQEEQLARITYVITAMARYDATGRQDQVNAR